MLPCPCSPMRVLVVSLCLVWTVAGHQKMTCPSGLSPRPDSEYFNGEAAGPCGGLIDSSFYYDGDASGMYAPPITHVNAGDRLKVAWTPNNHQTGFARIALVAKGQESIFASNILKWTCNGQQPGSADPNNVNCQDPCGNRGSCEYQKDINDFNRFDTTITIPTNLADGLYTLQQKAWVTDIYHTCAYLNITGGNTALSCPATTLAMPACIRSQVTIHRARTL